MNPFPHTWRDCFEMEFIGVEPQQVMEKLRAMAATAKEGMYVYRRRGYLGIRSGYTLSLCGAV